MRTVFIFAYYSFKDPVFQSAVLPYFENFPEKGKYRFVLLTFEQKQYKLGKDEASKLKEELKNKHNILWYTSTWHSGKFKLLKKAFDFFRSMILSISLIVKFKAKVIYSEGFPGAIIGHYLSHLTSTKPVIHTFEPPADYMIDSGVWKSTSWEAKLIKRLQTKMARHATVIFTATKKYAELFTKDCPNTLFYRVPSCVDLDLFKFDEKQRKELRTSWCIADDTVVLVYLGKFGGMYWSEELFDMFDVFLRSKKLNFKFLIISREDKKPFLNRINDNVIWVSANKEEVPYYLSAADIAVSAVRNIPSQRYSSPIKHGEYWAMELPVIIPKGVSDDFILAQEQRIGYVLNSLEDSAYKDCLKEVEKLFEHKRLPNARAFVERDRSVKHYQESIYAKVLDEIFKKE